MPLFNLILVALVQGITEFLPVSSSGHLILLPLLTGAPDQGLAIDVAVHVGTLLAVIVYFRAEVGAIIAGLPRLLTGRADTAGAKLALLLAIATVPVVLAGLAIKWSGLDEAMRSTAVIGWTMLLFGVVLYWTDQHGATNRQQKDWNLRDAITLGLWQAVALIPGTSRSGITISGARYLGYDRSGAARIAMLMSIPTIAASGVLLGADVAVQGDWQMLKLAALAAAFAFAAALLALVFMMRLLRSVSFTPYVIYRVILGAILLWIAYRPV